MPILQAIATEIDCPAPLELFDGKARLLVKDLHQVKPGVFWTDLLCSAGAGWLCFASAITSPPESAQFVFSVFGACLLLYRALCFMHELTHVRKSALPGFEFAWNLIAGVPLLMPSFVYVGVHQDHHNLATYGTDLDPEYLPFAGSRVAVVLFLMQSMLIPLFLLLRFLVLSWPSLWSKRFLAWLAVHASSLSMNIRYARPVTPDLLGRMLRWQVCILLFWGAAGFASIRMGIGWRVLLVWYTVTALASLINSLRTLAAHHYESSGAPRTRLEQVTDSLDTPGGPWTELWAPVGLRYHGVHHYFPGIPYHNLAEAYRRLTPADSPYRAVSSPGMAVSLGRLMRRRLETPAAK